MPDIKWIKLTTDIFDDEKIRLIEAMPDADTLLIIWIKLLCMAGKVNANGYIFLSRDIPYSDENLSVLMGRQLNTVRLALSTFQRLEMIKMDEKGFIFLPKWEVHQNVVGLETIRENARLRQQKHRDQLQLENGHVTSRDSHELSRDQKEKEKESKNKSIETPLPEWIKLELWDAFMDVRKQKKTPNTPTAIKLLVNKLSKAKDDGDDPNKLLEEAIMSGWKSVVTSKERSKNNNYHPSHSDKPQPEGKRYQVVN